MKTKLTLLLALALSASASAEKPNFNGVKPTIKAPAVRSVPVVRQAPPVRQTPAVRSAPSVPSNRIPPSANVGQIIGIARSMMPLVTNAPQYQPRHAAPPPPRALPPQNTSRPAVTTHKPVTQYHITKPGSLTRNPPAGIRSNVPSAVSGIDPNLAPALAASREIANGLQSLESLRGSISSLREFGDVFHQPGNSGSGSRGNVADPFGNEFGSGGNREVKNPLDRFSSGRPRDIRGDMSNSRKGDGTTGLSRTGDAILEDETSMASGRDGTHTPVESTTHENGDVTASTTTTTRDGSTTTSVEVTEYSDGSGTTTTTHGNDGHTDTITTTRRDSTGDVLWSTTDSVHEGGKQHRVTRDGSGRVTSDVTEYFRQRSTPRPDPEGGTPVGQRAPSAAQVSGLIPLDLLRQFANGESSSGGTNYMTRGIGGRQVRPENGESTSTANRLKKDLFGTISNPGPHGGEGPLVGGNPPD